MDDTAAASAPATSSRRSITVGVLLFEGYEPLDVVGPVSVFGSVEDVTMVYIAQAAGPVTSQTGNCGESSGVV
jgi:putative intracellular protease/amidase